MRMRIPVTLACLLLIALPALADDASMPAIPGAATSTELRRPLPLLPMMAEHQKRSMRGHLEAVQEIVTALAIDDFAGIERAAARLGYSDEVGQMCEHMGAAAAGFSGQALAFHHTADRIGVAARDHDHQRVLRELSATLQACKGCHAAWKQEVVDEATWRKLATSTQ
jgi:hypothetical protein